ncbi:hypothetical protein [Aristaeella hokkaidonensis]|uniref:Uncharacterized protein n=1 Tax=Aristaeella hokkaidonensis TaxID=3046382 RepID=A0AC61MVI0_9FIRM|nr:hypothetical protein [Aristaeella hokkaidonensis]QUC66515.1 hypothetical protein JYE49_11680 [Aristaeella hokkaidonensis]
MEQNTRIIPRFVVSGQASGRTEKSNKKSLPTVDFFDIIRIWHILALQKAAPKVREEVKE